MKKMSVLLVSVLAAFAVALPAAATIGVTVNGTDISAGSGTSPAWTYDGTNLALTASGASYVISGNNNGNTVSIQPQANCRVVASNLVIDVSGTGDTHNYIAGVLAFDCGTHAVTLALWSNAGTTNTFKGGYRRAGIRTTDGSLAITDLNASAALSARGGNSGAGIGGDFYGAGGTVTISGGTVTATGGTEGAGIGGGFHGAGGTVTISGGTVTATGGTGGAGIGGGQYDGAGGTVTVSGGTVIATGDHAHGAEDIGPGYNETSSGANTFTGGSICLPNGTIARAPSNGTARVYSLTIPGVTTADALADVCAFLAGRSYTTTGIVARNGNVYAWLPNGDYAFSVAGAEYRVRIRDGNATAMKVGPRGVLVNGTDIGEVYGGNGADAWDYSGTTLAFRGAGPYVVSGSNGARNVVSLSPQVTDTTLVLSNLTVDVSGASASALYIGANPYAVTLLLAGTNTLSGGGTSAGVTIEKGSGSLAISNLEASAALVVRGGSGGGAGIGGGNGRAGGTVAIQGGIVSATGGVYSAGIGGGEGGAGGTVTISGGTVTATGGESGAGIGGGYSGAGGTVTISGGTVTATGGESGAGIGGGDGGAGGTATISGGTVFASAGWAGQSIGHGRNSSSSGANTFTGGSIDLANGSISQAPSNGTARVWCVTFPYVRTATAFADLTDGLARLSPAYGVNGITARGGKVYAWLPDGDYSFATGNNSWRAHVNGAATTASYTVGVTVNGTDIGAGSGTNPAWTYDGANLALTAAETAYVISGTNNGGSVSIRAQADCTVVASNLVIDASGTGDHANDVTGVSAFDCGTNAVTLALWSDTGRANVFKGGYFCAGIRTTDGSLAITNLNESAALSAQGGAYSAGIGGDYEGAGGTVTISGGSVVANCRGWGAGIGGGYGGAGGTVTISGGFVSATGGDWGAGIGGGGVGNGGILEVSGGTVIATGDQANGAEDVGYGHKGAASGANTFTGGSIRLANGTVSLVPSNGTARVWRVTFANITSAAALAELTRSLAALGYGVRDITAPDGKVYAWLPTDTYFLTLGGKPTRLTIDAVGFTDFQPAALIGVTVNGRDIAYGSWAANDWSYNGANLSFLSAGPYVVSGANAQNSVSLSPKVDGTTLVLSNLTIDVSALVECTALWCGGHDTELRLLGTNTLKSGLRRPGIQTTGATLAITNLESAAALVATGGGDGAGIGGAQHNDGGTVRIYGGIITAAGDGGGSGIGGGAYGNGGDVRIFGGLVTASGGNGAAGIGGGWDGNGGTLEVSGGTVRATRGDRGSVSAFYDIGGEIDHGESKFTSGANIFTGGSVWLANGLIAAAPSNGTERVFCVTNGGFVAGAPVSLGLSGYGTDGLVADASGNVYLWLPAGGYIEGGTTAAGSFLRGFGVTATGAVTGPTNAVLTITGYDAAADTVTYSPAALPGSALETLYSVDLEKWSADRPAEARALFMRLRVK